MRGKIDSISIADGVETVVKDILCSLKPFSSTHNKITDWFLDMVYSSAYSNELYEHKLVTVLHIFLNSL